MKTHRNFYRVWRRELPDGPPIVQGTARECARFLGKGEDVFRNMATYYSLYGKGKYIVLVSKEPGSKASAIRQWDNFVTPLRKKYYITAWKDFEEDEPMDEAVAKRWDEFITPIRRMYCEGRVR